MTGRNVVINFILLILIILKTPRHKKIPLSLNRRMVIASLNSNKQNAIHALTKIDVTIPRKLRKDYFQKSGKKISFNAYIVRCFAEAIKEFPEMNSFIRGKKLILLEDINISLMVEREIDGVKIPEPCCIKKADSKSVDDIQNEIKKAITNTEQKLGSLSGSSWINLIPGFLFRFFIKIADRSIKMTSNYGKIAITSPGMYASSPTWFIPHGTATVFLVIGNISKENVLSEENSCDNHEILHLTITFDHEIVDGAPAARFVSRFEQILKSGDLMHEFI